MVAFLGGNQAASSRSESTVRRMPSSDSGSAITLTMKTSMAPMRGRHDVDRTFASARQQGSGAHRRGVTADQGEAAYHRLPHPDTGTA